MLSRKFKRYILNPCLGLTPLLLYYILVLTGLDIGASFLISLFLGVIAEFILRRVNKVAQMGFYITFTVIVLTYLVWVFTKKYVTNPYLYLILPEVLSVFYAVTIRFFKTLLNYRLTRKENVPVQKFFFSEFFDSTIYVQYVFTAHIFVVVVYVFLQESDLINYNYGTFMFNVVPIFLILLLIVTESVKLNQIAKRLKKENWIPIVNEKGDITGKIARSVSVTMKNKYIHPVVRVALVCDGKLYIQPRSSEMVVDPNKLDHPFEKYVLYSHDINQAVNNCITKIMGKEYPHRFVLKYMFKNEITNRLIFLHVINISNDEELSGIDDGALKGKFWSTTEIDEMYGDSDIFCECFQLEYEYLKNVVLFADNIANQGPVV